MDQRSFAFCCQHLSFFSVNTDIGVHTQAQQSYNLQKKTTTLRFRRKLVFFASLALFDRRHAKPPKAVTQASRDDHKDSREKQC